MIDIEKIKNELTFTTSRSGGSGGQHVNKVETKVTLRFNVIQSQALSEEQKDMIIRSLKNDINRRGQLILHHEETRSQFKNRELLIKKFFQLINKVIQKPKPRKETKPSREAVKQRLENKKRRSEVKAARKKVDFP